MSTATLTAQTTTGAPASDAPTTHEGEPNMTSTGEGAAPAEQEEADKADEAGAQDLEQAGKTDDQFVYGVPRPWFNYTLKLVPTGLTCRRAKGEGETATVCGEAFSTMGRNFLALDVVRRIEQSHSGFVHPTTGKVPTASLVKGLVENVAAEWPCKSCYDADKAAKRGARKGKGRRQVKELSADEARTMGLEDATLLHPNLVTARDLALQEATAMEIEFPELVAAFKAQVDAIWTEAEMGTNSALVVPACVKLRLAFYGFRWQVTMTFHGRVIEHAYGSGAMSDKWFIRIEGEVQVRLTEMAQELNKPKAPYAVLMAAATRAVNSLLGAIKAGAAQRGLETAERDAKKEQRAAAKERKAERGDKRGGFKGGEAALRTDAVSDPEALRKMLGK